MLFEELNLKPELLKAIKHLGFTETTGIQEKCIPSIQEGKDIVAQSSTGSGKTAAFGLPLLEKLQTDKGIQLLVLTPTRELCVQVADAMQGFAKFLSHVRIVSVYGGVSIVPQIDHLRRANIVVGTPGRILDHISRNTINFQHVKFLVLDEADKMFEMGFIEAVEEILRHIPQQRQTLLFSATIPQAVMHLVRKHLKNPMSIKGETYVHKTLLKQVYYVIPTKEKFSLLAHLLKGKPEGLALIFCATRRETDLVAKNLKLHGIQALAIHGGLTQNKRELALEALKNGHVNTLVATDVAARGLDIKSVSHVYNYDVPKSPNEYIHRIGRTARAGSNGEAVTLLSERDYDNFNHILSDRSLEIKKEQLPHFPQVAFQRGFAQDRERRPFHQGQRNSFPRRGNFRRNGPQRR